jgi:phosphoribosylglycinamide formyltransferase-1
MLRRTKCAILVSGGGTNLQAIIDAREAGALRHAELAVVISSRADAYALTRAMAAGIPTEIVSRKAFPEQDRFEERMLEVLEAYGVEMIVLAGFMSILSEDFTRRYDKRIINVHPSLIPSFCGKGFYGLRVHEAALAYGVKVTGATVHYVNEVPDGGEIILQKAVTIRLGETPESLQQRGMQQAEWKILPRAVELVAARLAGNKRDAKQKGASR